MKYIIALFGKSGSGKDTILKYFKNKYPEINSIIHCTTRPKRDYEEEGRDYFFLSHSDFTKKVLNGSMIEAYSFNNWFYGTGNESIKEDALNIGVFNIESLKCLMQQNINILPIYIEASDKTRLLRNLNREENPDCKEICRRFESDNKDFNSYNLDFQYYIYMNESKNINIENKIPLLQNWLKMFNII